jgi:DNA repair protein NreA
MNIPPSLCVKCRGNNLCGLPYCPILANHVNLKPLDAKSIEGYTPPSIFVGRVGYPKISIGPMIPSIPVDEHKVSIYDKPEEWSNVSIKDILRFRLTLVRGKVTVNANSACNSSDKMVTAMQEIAMTDNPVEARMHISRVSKMFSISETIPPFGPSAELERLDLGNIRVDHRIEKAYHDDINAKDAIIELYNSNVSVTSIARALSAGCLGVKKRRRFVPTRWSITAVDDTVSRFLIYHIKNKAWVNEPLVYVREVYLNRFVCIIAPGPWEFEWIEAWYPDTVWNKDTRVEIIGDHEGYDGLKHYAIVGGCYYSSRLAACEYLKSINRQGKVLMLREVYPGFDIPIGVWFVREQLRAMFKGKPLRFSSVEDAVKYAMSNLKIPLREWIKRSYMLRQFLDRSAKSLWDYIA